MNKNKKFRMETIEEVISFSTRLDNYMSMIVKTALPYINICNAFKLCHSFDAEDARNANRLFSAILDLKLTFVMILIDSYRHSAIHNASLKYSSDNILESDRLFAARMDMLHYDTNMIMRYRSFFDKFWGILIMMYKEDKYSEYLKAKSRKHFFYSLAQSIPQISKELANSMNDAICKFDEKFRTPEVHLTGTVRNWVFSNTHYHETPLIELMEYWNYLLPILTAFDNVIESECKTRKLI